MPTRFEISDKPTQQIDALIEASGSVGLKTILDERNPAVPILRSRGFLVVRRTLTGTLRPDKTDIIGSWALPTDASICDMASATGTQMNQWLALHLAHYRRTHDADANARLRSRASADIFTGGDYHPPAAFALWHDAKLAAFASLRQTSGSSWDFGWFGTAEHITPPLRRMFNLELKSRELAYARQTGIETLWIELDDTSQDAGDVMEALSFEHEATYLAMVRNPDQL